MRLSSRARYAVRLTLEVHRQGDTGDPVRLSDVAKATNISKSFLEQLAMALKSHCILRAICGRNGGYLLGRAANEITIGDVLRAVTGPIDLVTEIPKDCATPDFCQSRLVWMLLEQRINQLLDDYTIADISDETSLESIRDLLNTERAHGGGTSGVLQK
ncbi:MAG: Rrf2 family transcriptional regulator [Candidatus Latescibacterota bacterium]|nr:MAG: Rrf2 family transcriptional regulator [Candidatus Latescibacterota bacterium]